MPPSHALERSLKGSNEHAAGAQNIVVPAADPPRLARPAQRER